MEAGESQTRKDPTGMGLDCRLHRHPHLVVLWGQSGGTSTSLKAAGLPELWNTICKFWKFIYKFHSEWTLTDTYLEQNLYGLCIRHCVNARTITETCTLTTSNFESMRLQKNATGWNRAAPSLLGWAGWQITLALHCSNGC